MPSADRLRGATQALTRTEREIALLKLDNCDLISVSPTRTEEDAERCRSCWSVETMGVGSREDPPTRRSGSGLTSNNVQRNPERPWRCGVSKPRSVNFLVNILRAQLAVSCRERRRCQRLRRSVVS